MVHNKIAVHFVHFKHAACATATCRVKRHVLALFWGMLFQTRTQKTKAHQAHYVKMNLAIYFVDDMSFIL